MYLFEKDSPVKGFVCPSSALRAKAAVVLCFWKFASGPELAEPLSRLGGVL